METNLDKIKVILEKETLYDGDYDSLYYLFDKEGHDIRSVLCRDVIYGMKLILKIQDNVGKEKK